MHIIHSICILHAAAAVAVIIIRSICFVSFFEFGSSIRQSVYSEHCLNVFSTRSNGAILFIRAASIGSNKSEEEE